MPYSRFAVGAAALAASGKVYTGVNIENASYGLTVCAERVAIWKAVSEGEREIKAVAVVTSNSVTPCGACRQVMAEFAPKAGGLTGTRLIVADASGPLSQLHPGRSAAGGLHARPTFPTRAERSSPGGPAGSRTGPRTAAPGFAARIPMT